ncbi:MAG: hypothetical protein Phyf2KO_27650 [Phycisphaerales bacterium]
MKAILTACGLGLSATLATPAAAQLDDSRNIRSVETEGKVITVLSPLRVDERIVAKDFVTPLSFNDADYEFISSAERINILDFPIDRHLTVDLELESFDVVSPNAVRVTGQQGNMKPAKTGDITLLRGEITGIPDSWVYLAISPRMNNGIIDIQGTTYILSSGASENMNSPVIYNMTDLPEGEISWVEYACTALPNPNGSGFSLLGDGDGGDDGDPFGQPCRIVNVAIEGDNELSDLFGTADPDAAEELTNMYIEALVGGVSQIYTRTWNMQIQIVFTRVFGGGEAANPDPWQGNTTPAALTELRELWSSPSRPYDGNPDPWHGVHLLSARPLGGGIAYLNAICNPDLAMAVSGNLNGAFPNPLVDNDSQNWDVVVTAHEWGHNFGAPHTHGLVPVHDACGFGDCTLAPFGTIMSYCHTCPGGLANIELTFADRIITEGIIPYVSGLFTACDLADNSPDGCTGDPNEPADCPADTDGDGVLTGADFTAWLIAYNNGDLSADLNNNGTLEPSDFTAWLIAFQTGCDE